MPEHFLCCMSMAVAIQLSLASQWHLLTGDKDKRRPMFCNYVNLTPLPPFHPWTEPSSISQHWKSWKLWFETYLVTLNITEDKQKRVLLLYQAGQATQEIFDAHRDRTGLCNGDYKAGWILLPEELEYEVFLFRQAVQKAGETVDQFTTWFWPGERVEVNHHPKLTLKMP